jgi:hypothetical protein
VNFLFLVTLLEVFLGGGGRLIAFGPVSLRMILLAACLCAAVIVELLRWRRADGQWLAIWLVLAYLLVHLPGLMLGAYRGAEPAEMFTEFQQSLYWVAAPFFAMELQSPKTVERAAMLVRVAGIVLAIAYLTLLLGLATGAVDAKVMLAVVAETQEFNSRGDGLLFYKGFLYLGLGIVFLIAQRSRYWLPLVILVFAALIMTLTRGFILAAAISVLTLLIYQRRVAASAFGAIVMLGAAYVVWAYVPSLDEDIASTRDVSNTIRLDDISFIGSHATAATVMFGEGFGSLINDRFNIENTFLWAWWKLGIAGVIFWLTPLILCAYYFARIPARRSNGLACGFFFGTVFVYVETNTNPFLNNPIGLVFVLLAVFSLRTLAKSTLPERPPQSALNAIADPQGAL